MSPAYQIKLFLYNHIITGSLKIGEKTGKNIHTIQKLLVDEMHKPINIKRSYF